MGLEDFENIEDGLVVVEMLRYKNFVCIEEGFGMFFHIKFCTERLRVTKSGPHTGFKLIHVGSPVPKHYPNTVFLSYKDLF